jgi:hypothetical protein
MASRSWFYATDGQQHGPYSEDQFRDLIARGVVGPTTLVWADEMSDWTKAGDVPGLLRSAPGVRVSFDQAAGRGDPSFAGSDAFHGAPTGDRMQELEVNFGRLLRIYWLFIWRSVLGALLIGFTLGFIVGVVFSLLGLPLTLAKTAGGVLGVVGGAVWGLFCLKMAIEKKYRDFRIMLVPREIELT